MAVHYPAAADDLFQSQAGRVRFGILSQEKINMTVRLALALEYELGPELYRTLNAGFEQFGQSELPPPHEWEG